MPQPLDGEALSALVMGEKGARAEIAISASESYVPWAGHLARHAMADVMAAIRASRTTLIFVNTRSQAERTFQDLWRINDENLPIALHHGSLAPEQRRKVESAMAKGSLRAVVATSTLDLGVDWGAVDRVIAIGAPKGAARLVQRIGRANHRLDEPSAALSWCPPTASRCWNVMPPRATRCWRANSMARYSQGRAVSTCLPSICSERPALRRSTRAPCSRK